MASTDEISFIADGLSPEFESEELHDQGWISAQSSADSSEIHQTRFHVATSSFQLNPQDWHLVAIILVVHTPRDVYLRHGLMNK
jgi:hypothetical protein